MTRGPWRQVVRGVASFGAAIVVVALVLAAAVAWNERDDPGADDAGATTAAPAAAQVARGAYLARVGNCAGCHTARGGATLAGGRAFATPFGTVYAGNLTPDAATGLGAWSAQDFRRALHRGRSRDGRLLVPAFPYTEFTRVTRDDSDALFAFLRSVAPVVQANAAHALRFPYDSQAALALWRLAYFRRGGEAVERGRGDEPQQQQPQRRGEYLVRGLGHCAACHAPRNALGAHGREMTGGDMPGQRWYAPALGGDAVDDTVELLRSGRSRHASAAGPMAEVVFASTQHWTDADLRAAAVYLRSLRAPAARTAWPAAPADVIEAGRNLYAKHCADCHGARGQGAPGAYVPLAANPGVVQASPRNLVQVLRHGGFAPDTAANPRPYGMPPMDLTDVETAAVLSFVRQSWGNDAPAVSALDVLRLR